MCVNRVTLAVAIQGTLIDTYSSHIRGLAAAGNILFIQSYESRSLALLLLARLFNGLVRHPIWLDCTLRTSSQRLPPHPNPIPSFHPLTGQRAYRQPAVHRRLRLPSAAHDGIRRSARRRMMRGFGVWRCA